MGSIRIQIDYYDGHRNHHHEDPPIVVDDGLDGDAMIAEGRKAMQKVWPAFRDTVDRRQAADRAQEAEEHDDDGAAEAEGQEAPPAEGQGVAG